MKGKAMITQKLWNHIQEKTQEQIEERAKKIQPVIDEMLTIQQYKQYVERAELSLIDSEFKDIDLMLKLGILRGYKESSKDKLFTGLFPS